MGTDEINDVGSSWRKVIRTLETDDRVSPRQRGFVVLAQAQGLIGTTLLVAVPNELTREVLQTQLKHILDEVLRGVFQADIQCAFVIDADMIPAVKAFVLSTDMEANRMEVRLIEGMRSDEN